MFNSQFAIDRLILFDFKGNTFSYEFEPGLNYIKGRNDSGKTQFFEFIDFMLGKRSEDIGARRWYKDTLQSASLELHSGNNCCILTRSLDNRVFRCLRNGVALPVESLADYCEAIDSFFCESFDKRRILNAFMEQNITYRTFTLFSFLAEGYVGEIQPLFSKLNETRYRVKERPLFDYLFNNNIDEINRIQEEISFLTASLDNMRKKCENNEFIAEQIDNRLAQLGIRTRFKGNNREEIERLLSCELEPNDLVNQTGSTTLADLEYSAAQLKEQISLMQVAASEKMKLAKADAKRIRMLEEVNSIASSLPEYEELLESTKVILEELKGASSIKSSQIYLDLIPRKERQLKEITREISTTRSQVDPMSTRQDEVTRNVILDYLERYDESLNRSEIDRISQRLSDLKAALKEKRLSIDNQKISWISSRITSLYVSAAPVADFSKRDASFAGFAIQYVKESNSLQATIANAKETEIYYTGSRARHALMQLAAYCAFAEFLLDQDVPFPPLLVFDHISSPFDPQNRRSIGALFKTFFQIVDPESIQVFLFDNVDPGALSISCQRIIDLNEGDQTGFNPFYNAEFDNED